MIESLTGQGIRVQQACIALGVSQSGFYAWKGRPDAPRTLRRIWLAGEIADVHKESGGTYGAMRITAELKYGRGIAVGHNAVSDIMRQLGLKGLPRRRLPRGAKLSRITSLDLVGRKFRRDRPNELWVTDITEHPTREGKVFCCVVLDSFSRKVVGWSIDSTQTTGLVLNALGMATQRRPDRIGLVMHSDRGVQGGFKRSSQQLDETRLRWARRSRRGRRRGARGCGRRDGRRSPVGRVDHRRRFWRAITRGDTSLEAAAFSGVSGPVGVRWFREGGGMPTVTLHAPSARYLCFAEREDIALLRAEGKGVREIAREIGRAPSTISRELRRNAATRAGKLEYRPSVAQWHAERRAKRPKPAKLAVNHELREYVQSRLAGQVRRPDGTAIAGPVTRAWTGRNKPRRQDRRWANAWSPEQISGRLAVEFPDDLRCVSPTRRSTRRCSCRAAARWPAS